MRLLFVLLFCACVSTSFCQTSTEDSVKQVINNFFLGMKNADANLVASTMADSVVLQTIDTRSGTVKVINEKPADFIKMVGKFQPGLADEQVTFKNFLIDANLASVWMSYKFFYKGNFSHCGYNSFQLVRFNGSWKIQYIIDTRRKDNCPG